MLPKRSGRWGPDFHWICDSMDNDLKHALGDRPNSEFIIDPKGEIVVARQWSKPAQLREELEELVGKVDRPTTVADLNMRQLPPPSKAATGIVKRVELPGGMSPLKITPVVIKAKRSLRPTTPSCVPSRAAISFTSGSFLILCTKFIGTTKHRRSRSGSSHPQESA